MIKKLRLTLSRQICNTCKNENNIITAFEISEKTLDKFLVDFEEGDDAIIRIDANFGEKLANKLNKKFALHNIENPKVLAPLELRQLIFTLISNYINGVTVLAREEIGCNAEIEVIDTV